MVATIAQPKQRGELNLAAIATVAAIPAKAMANESSRRGIGRSVEFLCATKTSGKLTDHGRADYTELASTNAPLFQCVLPVWSSTMAVQTIWTEHKVLARALGFELASLQFSLDDDIAHPLPGSVSLQIVVRVAGVQIGESLIHPLRNGAVHVPLLAQIGGTLDGRVDNYRALDASGKTVAWHAAVALGFEITALGNVTVPIETIAKFVPVIGPLLSAALALVGNKVSVALAHDDLIVHLPRTA